MASAKLWSTVKNYQKSLNPFVYAAAAAVKIKRSKYMFGYKKKCCLLFMGPTFYCVTNAVIAKQQEAAFVSTVNNGQHIFTHCAC